MIASMILKAIETLSSIIIYNHYSYIFLMNFYTGSIIYCRWKRRFDGVMLDKMMRDRVMIIKIKENNLDVYFINIL